MLLLVERVGKGLPTLGLTLAGLAGAQRKSSVSK